MEKLKPYFALSSTLAIMLLSSCGGTEVYTKPVQVAPGQCDELPVGLKSSPLDLDLEGLHIGDFALGKGTIKITPTFEKIMSEASKDRVVSDYLVCKAIIRAGVSSDPELVAYFTQMQIFLQGRPSAAEQIEWLSRFPFPKKKGKLELSGPRDSRNGKILIIPSDAPIQTMGVINAGDGPLTWWPDYFPYGQFYSGFPVGRLSVLPAMGNQTFEIVRTAKAELRRSYPFKIKTNTSEEVVIQITAEGKDAYASLRSELFWQYEKRIMPHDLNLKPDPNEVYALDTAEQMIKEKFPQTSEGIRHFVVSQLLYSAQFYKASELAFTRAAAIQGDLDNENTRSLYLVKDYNEEATKYLKLAIDEGKAGHADRLTKNTEKALKAVKMSREDPRSKELITDLNEVLTIAYPGHADAAVKKAEEALKKAQEKR